MANLEPIIFGSALTTAANHPSNDGLLWNSSIGNGFFIVAGTYDGATIKLQIKYPGTSTWIDLQGTSVTNLSATPIIVAIPNNVYVRLNIAGVGASTSLSAQLMPINGQSSQLLNSLRASTTGGWSTHSALSAGSADGATVVKASPGAIAGWYISNTNANEAYVKLYNKATTPAVASDTPKLRICVPGNAAGAGCTVFMPQGITFDAGISYTIVTGAGDTDGTDVSANEVIVNLFYL